jgi:L-ascorbate metabolism protein UlaG (beta-lactamase superfamily)
MTISRRSFLKTSAAAGASLRFSLGLEPVRVETERSTMRIQLIRHATCAIQYGDRRLLLDPMLSDPGAMPPINNTPNPRSNPLVPLPIPATEVLSGAEAIVVTHTHRDHWDPAATKLVHKGTKLFIQPPDAPKFAEWGFSLVQEVQETVSWQGIRISRTGGQHGRGEIGRQMAPVSGYVLTAQSLPTLYIAGDTVWCQEVANAIQRHKPKVILVNAGAPQFLEGGPICMDTEDVVKVCEAAPKAKVIAVHMEAINHCLLTRNALRDGLRKTTLSSSVMIPEDGERLSFS